ncbi:MAG: hypothetical protein N4J56_001385 [Chroococcidiopsis sp. SAG 2025]|uniref:hypothetical protein n=1 Tax=Chroococcidiopsis sp. SAG 2025 TaxID=171389 RepID=UPI0029371E04|nr:hypothetical protein [Chroococcidiopsis sp. SAG 2025]MDV2991731.1 hypothetical protein [Chroococcidiopsis sp. SAG 2025]
MKQRDSSLDVIEGLACIMMILAHATLGSQESTLVKNLAFFGGFAPTLFYAVSDVTNMFQAICLRLILF